MKIGILLETNEPEKAWNGVRFANTALKQGHEVRLFLMSAGVEAWKSPGRGTSSTVTTFVEAKGPSGLGPVQGPQPGDPAGPDLPLSLDRWPPTSQLPDAHDERGQSNSRPVRAKKHPKSQRKYRNADSPLRRRPHELA
ncbi:MAG: hypothetical protein IPN59_11835 [Holophaga sp.]|nr:hypothetical protein [Holophaga sp.]